jgi:hypothetical protein
VFYLALPVKRSANQPQSVAILAVFAVPLQLPAVCTNQQSSLLLSTYSAVQLIPSLPFDTVSLMFATPLPNLTNNSTYQFYMVLTVQYCT